MDNHIRCRSVIGYMVLTFDVTKCHFKSKKILCQVPESSLRLIYVNFHKPICPLWPFKKNCAAVTAHNSYSSSSSSRSSSSRSSSSSIAGERHSLRALKHRPRHLAWPEGPASIKKRLCMYISLNIFPKDNVYPFYFPKIYILKILFQNIFKGYTSAYCSVAYSFVLWANVVWFCRMPGQPQWSHLKLPQIYLRG